MNFIDKYFLKRKLKKYGVENFIINSDETITVNGDVHLKNKFLTRIPFKFKKVTGNFDCSCNQLVNLVGCPTEVGLDFCCAVNELKTLKGCPTEIGRDFSCSHNDLESLQYSPSEIGADFYCAYNRLADLDTSSIINGNLVCYGNNIREDFSFYGDITLFSKVKNLLNN